MSSGWCLLHEHYSFYHVNYMINKIYIVYSTVSGRCLKELLIETCIPEETQDTFTLAAQLSQYQQQDPTFFITFFSKMHEKGSGMISQFFNFKRLRHFFDKECNNTEIDFAKNILQEIRQSNTNDTINPQTPTPTNLLHLPDDILQYMLQFYNIDKQDHAELICFRLFKASRQSNRSICLTIDPHLSNEINRIKHILTKYKYKKVHNLKISNNFWTDKIIKFRHSWCSLNSLDIAIEQIIGIASGIDQPLQVYKLKLRGASRRLGKYLDLKALSNNGIESIFDTQIIHQLDIDVDTIQNIDLLTLLSSDYHSLNTLKIANWDPLKFNCMIQISSSMNAPNLINIELDFSVIPSLDKNITSIPSENVENWIKSIESLCLVSMECKSIKRKIMALFKYSVWSHLFIHKIMNKTNLIIESDYTLERPKTPPPPSTKIESIKCHPELFQMTKDETKIWNINIYIPSNSSFKSISMGLQTANDYCPFSIAPKIMFRMNQQTIIRDCETRKLKKYKDVKLRIGENRILMILCNDKLSFEINNILYDGNIQYGNNVDYNLYSTIHNKLLLFQAVIRIIEFNEKNITCAIETTKIL